MTATVRLATVSVAIVTAALAPAMAAQREFTYSIGFRGDITADKGEFA